MGYSTLQKKNKKIKKNDKFDLAQGRAAARNASGEKNPPSHSLYL